MSDRQHSKQTPPPGLQVWEPSITHSNTVLGYPATYGHGPPANAPPYFNPNPYGPPSSPTPGPHPPGQRKQTGVDFQVAKKIILNQEVSVNITGCGWLLGTVVGFVHAVSALTGCRVRVQYEEGNKIHQVPNDPAYIRPRY